jgi:hypothetical protein
MMATTGELRAIIEELKLIDAGDAASYLGEEAFVEDESGVSNLQEGLSGYSARFYDGYAIVSCADSSIR